MRKQFGAFLKNTRLSVMVSLSILVGILLPTSLLTVRGIPILRRTEFAVNSRAVRLVSSSFRVFPGETLSALEERVCETLQELIPDGSFSWFILKSDYSRAASGSLGGTPFPLELFPTREHLDAGSLVHDTSHRGQAVYFFSQLSPGLFLVTIWPVSALQAGQIPFLKIGLSALLAALFAASCALFLLFRYFIRPCGQLLLTMRNPGMDDQITSYVSWKNDIGILCRCYLQRFQEYLDSLEQIRQLNLEQRTSEIEVLQNQINAHFIYNTLNNIQWLASANRMDDVVRTARSLDILLRGMCTNDSDYVTIEEEITYVEAYLSSQKIRFNDVFDYSFQLDPLQMQMKIPKFILQPLVENSIYHGFLDAGRKNGHIRVSLRRKGHRILIEIHDNGIGIPEQEIFSILNNTQKSSDRYMGIAIGNINKRIQLLCGREYGIGIKSLLNSYTCVQVVIPIIPT